MSWRRGSIKRGLERGKSRGGWDGRECFGNFSCFSSVHTRVLGAKQSRKKEGQAQLESPGDGVTCPQPQAELWPQGGQGACSTPGLLQLEDGIFLGI